MLRTNYPDVFYGSICSSAPTNAIQSDLKGHTHSVGEHMYGNSLRK